MRRKYATEKCGTFSGGPEYIDNRTENGARLDFRFALFVLFVCLSARAAARLNRFARACTDDEIFLNYPFICKRFSARSARFC